MVVSSIITSQQCYPITPSKKKKNQKQTDLNNTETTTTSTKNQPQKQAKKIIKKKIKTPPPPLPPPKKETKSLKQNSLQKNNNAANRIEPIKVHPWRINECLHLDLHELYLPMTFLFFFVLYFFLWIPSPSRAGSCPPYQAKSSRQPVWWDGQTESSLAC